MAKITQHELETLSENLLKEAIEALKYGLKYNYDYCSGGNIGLLKQSIMNFHRFVEFTLKHFITNINPLLIFEKPFDKQFTLENPKTITFTQALNFFSHNLEFGILENTSKFNKIKFVSTLNSLGSLRNDVAHLFLSETNETKLQTIFSENIRLIYLIFIERNTHQKIEKYLNNEEKEMLEELINVEEDKVKKEEQLKLANALKQVRIYESMGSEILSV